MAPMEVEETMARGGEAGQGGPAGRRRGGSESSAAGGGGGRLRRGERS